MAGHLTGVRALRGVGLATGFSPFPKVFCEADGYEPFAATFALRGTDTKGQELVIPITAERYSEMAGPYNRRNVYGAALAFSPRLPEDLRDELLSQMLRTDSALWAELDLPDLTAPSIHVLPREGEAVASYEFRANQ